MSIQTKTMTVKSDTSLAETTTTIRDTVTFDVSKMPNGITYKGLKAVLSFAEPIQWNKASTYDALTVVWDDASHGSYASKRPVPANIELDNEFYWLRTADLDAQVEMYRQEVQEMDGRVTANTQAITANTQAITENSQKIAEETARAEGAERTLQTNIDNLSSNVKWLCIGDSWAARYDDSWADLICKRNHVGILKYAKGGAGFIVDGNTFQMLADKAIAEITDKSIVKRIVVVGGNNDNPVWNKDNWVVAFNNFIKTLEENFTNAVITFAPQNWAGKNNIGPQFIDRYKTMCETALDNSIKLVTGAYHWLQEPTMYDETAHPTSYGNKVFAGHLNSALDGSSYEYTGGIYVTLNPNEYIEFFSFTKPYYENGLLISNVSAKAKMPIGKTRLSTGVIGTVTGINIPEAVLFVPLQLPGGDQVACASINVDSGELSILVYGSAQEGTNLNGKAIAMVGNSRVK